MNVKIGLFQINAILLIYNFRIIYLINIKVFVGFLIFRNIYF